MEKPHTKSLQVFDNANECARFVAREIIAIVKSKPNAVLGLATGSTPVPIYQYLSQAYREGEVDFSQVTTVNLDEYVGLPPEHPQSYHYFMRKQLFDNVNIAPERQFVPDPWRHGVRAAEQFEELLATHGPVDLWLLGIGANGHVAFNEPGSAAQSRTRVVDLTPSTIAANARFFESAQDVPRQAVSVGIGTLAEHARRLVLVASGAAKAAALRAVLYGEVSEDVPASLLQQRLEIYCDRDALTRPTSLLFPVAGSL